MKIDSEARHLRHARRTQKNPQINKDLRVKFAVG